MIRGFALFESKRFTFIARGGGLWTVNFGMIHIHCKWAGGCLNQNLCNDSHSLPGVEDCGGSSNWPKLSGGQSAEQPFCSDWKIHGRRKKNVAKKHNWIHFFIRLSSFFVWIEISMASLKKNLFLESKWYSGSAWQSRLYTFLIGCFLYTWSMPARKMSGARDWLTLTTQVATANILGKKYKHKHKPH